MHLIGDTVINNNHEKSELYSALNSKCECKYVIDQIPKIPLPLYVHCLEIEVHCMQELWRVSLEGGQKENADKSAKMNHIP